MHVGIDEDAAQRRVAVRRDPVLLPRRDRDGRQRRHDPRARVGLDRHDAAQRVHDLREPVPVRVAGVALRVLERAHEDRVRGVGAPAGARSCPAVGIGVSDSRYRRPEASRYGHARTRYDEEDRR